MNDWNNDPNDPWADHAQQEQQDPWADHAQQQQQNPYAAPQQPHRAGDAYAGGLPQSTNGTLVLILGICSWFLCGLFTAIPGWLIARGDRKMIQAGMMAPDSTLEAGYWINFIAVLMTGIGILLAFAFFFFALIVGAAGSV